MTGVVVPVYKTERYVAECIESILSQTYTRFRLILVDDGSPDRAGAICDEYAKKDERITVVHQENAGVTRARARGVEEAADCEYITFVDSDDTIEPTYLEELTSLCGEETDIVMSIYDKVFIPKQSTIKRIEYLKMLLTDRTMCVAIWGKLYKRSVLKENVFEIPHSIKVCEDLIANIRIAYNSAQDIKVLPKRVYNYREYAESTVHSYNRTPENEVEIHRQKMISIPPEDMEYLLEYTIDVRLLRWREFWGYKYFCKEMLSSTFYNDLKRDIEKTKYKLGIIERILFYQTSPIIRFIAVNIRKIQNLITKNH